MYNSRKFDRMFPDIAMEEDEFTRDLLADGRMTAERNRRIRQDIANQEIQRQIQSQKNNTLEALLNIFYIYEDDSENWNILYYEAEKDEKWNIVIDQEKKRIKFIDKATWKFIYKEFK